LKEARDEFVKKEVGRVERDWKKKKDESLWRKDEQMKEELTK